NGSRSWYQGWNIVIAAAFISLLTAGIRMSVGPFFLPILEDFAISRTTLSIIVSVSMFTFGIGMPLAGYLERQFGPKTVLNLGVILNLLSTIWMITTQSVTGLLLSFGILTSFGLSFASQVTLTPLITKWFVKKRGQALFYLATGSMAGIAIMNPISNQLIILYDWKTAMLLFANALLLIVFPITLFVLKTDVPEEVLAIENKTQPKNDKAIFSPLTIKQSIQSSTFWYLCMGLFACGFSMNLIGSHGVPMLIDHGFSSTVASNSIGLIGLVAIPGTIIMGSFADKISKKWLLALIYYTRGIGIIAFVLVAATFHLYLVALIAGLAWAGNNSLSSAILSNIYGVKNVGVLYGLTFFAHQIGATIRTFLGCWTYETFGTHLASFISAGTVLFIAGTVSFN